MALAGATTTPQTQLMRELLINIDVDDIDRAITFYTSAFGVKLGRRLSDEFVELTGFTSPLYLLKRDSGTPPFSGARDVRQYQRHWTPLHLDVIVEDLEQATARAEAVGAQRESDVVEETYGRLAYYSDPFGHGFCFIEWRGKGYDELAPAPPPTG